MTAVLVIACIILMAIGLRVLRGGLNASVNHLMSNSTPNRVARLIELLNTYQSELEAAQERMRRGVGDLQTSNAYTTMLRENAVWAKALLNGEATRKPWHEAPSLIPPHPNTSDHVACRFGALRLFELQRRQPNLRKADEALRGLLGDTGADDPKK